MATTEIGATSPPGTQFKKKCPLSEFIILTSSPLGGEELMDDFRDDPDAVGAAYGLSDPQIRALESGDAGRIQAELDAEGCGRKVKLSLVGLLTV